MSGPLPNSAVPEVAPEVVVVDYGAANLLSITRALEAVGARVRVSGDPQAMLAAPGVVLPGVGAAGAAMARLRTTGADEALREVAARGRPFLGVCLGMQLLFERLEEDEATGLGILAGDVVRLAGAVKVPHMGWNQLSWVQAPGGPREGAGAALFDGVRPGMYAYFVHSYVCQPRDARVVAATTEYGGTLCAAVATGGIWGCQFHPEKSGADGLRLLANWVWRVAEYTTSARSGTSAVTTVRTETRK